jgi:hypothetical protein
MGDGPVSNVLKLRDRARGNWLGCAPAGLCLLLALSDGSTFVYAKQPRVQGPWAFTESSDREPSEHLATTPSAEDSDTWLLIACGVDHSLVVAVMHASGARFDLGAKSSVKVRSRKLADLPVAAKTVQANEIAIEPDIMRQILPRLLDEDSFVVSIAGQNEEVRDYTFLMQPNDIALAPARAHCLDSE